MPCSNWEGGYFAAYRHLAARGDLDAVVHLGDYIYEYKTGEFGGRAGGVRSVVVLADVVDAVVAGRDVESSGSVLLVVPAEGWAGLLPGQVAVASGANTNFDRLRFIAEEAEVGEHREAILAVTIPERPGSFRKFCATLGGRNVTEFNYRIADSTEAHVFVGVEVRAREETDRMVRNLRRHGLRTLDLSDNEMAKTHVRHMVGGRAPFARNELLYRFEFPERPGALLRFLESMRSDWNISLFHYRNQGADYGRVLVGMQVPRDELNQFRVFLKKLGYPYADETRNPAYKLFLV